MIFKAATLMLPSSSARVNGITVQRFTIYEFTSVLDYLTTEIATSKQKKFSLVTFVDTPGLVDGDMKYPFDVNKSILWLGDLADLIFVFFDPIGQALCKRTLNLVEKLNEKHADRMRFYLSKADEAGHESDRQRVMMQIVQELCKRPGLNRTGFDMPTIYVPSMNQKGSRCANQIEEVCKDIEKTINQTVQNTLNALERDCNQISQIVEEKLREDSFQAKRNLKARLRGVCYSLLGMLLPLLLLATFLISTSHAALHSLLGEELMLTIDLYLGTISGVWQKVPAEYSNYVIGGFMLLALFMLAIAKFTSRTRPTLTRKQKRGLQDVSDYVQNVVKNKKQTLYGEYLRQSVADQDL
ncbi:hypothetical protein C0Q70_06672 [Pomacea canaliculata]|uniref:G domain-containing protein n=1 Tax=Pomacea canaliculata TaxID=400727 RepID=A0A2T7PCW8_POMCA|nr:hypothetical protein C0Q70_06672 [Pomacea canaliculata]